MTIAAQGRLNYGEPIAIIDIGSNSVRLVAYEGLSRSPTPIFNEKVMCGLGKKVLSTGRLSDEAMAKALAALARFRVLVETMGIKLVKVIATAAARDASNGPDFLARCAEVTGIFPELISGKREAELTAWGVVSGIHQPDGVAGDLGGGSLELIDVKGNTLGKGVTLPLGALSLQDRSDGSIRKARKIIRDGLTGLPQLKALSGRSFYAIGGTWRALARLHMRQRGYPLQVMHNYVISAADAVDFASLVERVEIDTLDSIEAVSTSRRPLLNYGAMLLEEIIRTSSPKDIVVSALGVREGLLFEMLSKSERRLDPLMVAANDLNVLRSRAPGHGEELIGWTDNFIKSSGLSETQDEKRLRHAACLLADIGWRAHPDYRGEQSFNIIANAGFIGVDHPGRAFLALAVAYRHLGLNDDQVSPRLRELCSSRMIDRARILAGLMRIAYLISAAMPGVLPRIPLTCHERRLELGLSPQDAPLASDRLFKRLAALARIVGRTPHFVIG